MHRFLVLAVLLGLCSASTATAQGFLSPIPGIDARQPSYVILPNGERLDGAIPLAYFANGTLRSMTFKTDDGRKLKLKAADVKVLGHKPGALAKLSAMSDQIDNPWDLIGADWEGTMQRDWVIFKQARLPTKAERYALMQLLNPGFDSRLQVFYDAKAAGNDDTVMGISTAPAESYVVVLDGRTSIQVKKKNYRKLYPDLFGDCRQMMKSASEKKPKFKNFAGAVYAFDHLCGKKDGSGGGAVASSAPPKTSSSQPPREQREPVRETRRSEPTRQAAPKKARESSKPMLVIDGSVTGFTDSSETPLFGARIELRPLSPLKGPDKRPAADMLGLAITDSRGGFVIDELHSASMQQGFPLLVGWTYEVKVVATGHYVFKGIVEYNGETEPWDFVLEGKVSDVVDDSGVVAPDDRALQRGATRRGNR